MGRIRGGKWALLLSWLCWIGLIGCLVVWFISGAIIIGYLQIQAAWKYDEKTRWRSLAVRDLPITSQNGKVRRCRLNRAFLQKYIPIATLPNSVTRDEILSGRAIRKFTRRGPAFRQVLLDSAGADTALPGFGFCHVRPAGFPSPLGSLVLSLL